MQATKHSDRLRSLLLKAANPVIESALVTHSENAVTIVPVAMQEYAEWLDSSAQRTKTWLSQIAFKANPGSSTWVPGDSDGRFVLLIWNAEKTLDALMTLPLSLAEGDYRLEGGLEPEILNKFVLGWGMAAYQYQNYKVASRNAARLVIPENCDANLVLAQLRATTLIRDLINTPASDMLPSHLAQAALDFQSRHQHVDVDICVGEELLERGYRSIYTVGQASTNAPRLIDLRWGNTTDPKITLVGKGVCFDSGGLDIKPSSGMRQMKKDMGGAAHVLGLAELIISQQLPIRLRVLVPAVENAIAGNAYRPGDIITSYKGLSVEVGNTDAEGRLVLSDALTLACEEQPELLLDFATLTGAARVALGTDLPALFCNDDTVAREILDSAISEDDPLWRLPLHQPYLPQIKGEIADLVNTGSVPMGGAITAALFLEQFLNNNVSWAHIDLMAFNISSRPGHPEGGEAMSARAIYDYLARKYV